MTETVKKLWNKYSNKSYYVRISTLERAEKHGHRIVSICKKDGSDFKNAPDRNGNFNMLLLHLDNAVDYKPTKQEREENVLRVENQIFGSKK